MALRIKPVALPPHHIIPLNKNIMPHIACKTQHPCVFFFLTIQICRIPADSRVAERRSLRRAFYYIRKYTASKPTHKYTIHVPVPIPANAHKGTHTANMFGHQQIFKDNQLHLATLPTGCVLRLISVQASL